MSEKHERLEGRVAAILNSQELVINLGQSQGVKVGMKFAVLAESPLQILDPESGEVLDNIDREKVRVEASEVRNNVTVCKTFRVRRTPGIDLTGLTGILQTSREIKETLRIEDDSMPPPLSEEESYVKIKDRVVQVNHDGDESLKK